MKCLRRYFCVLLCFVLSLVVFSVGASAEESISYKINQNVQYPAGTTRLSLTFYPNNGTEEKKEYANTFGNTLPSGSYLSTYAITRTNANALFPGGRKVKVDFNNLYFSILYEDWFNGELLAQKYISTPTRVRPQIFYADGTNEILSPVSFDIRPNMKINVSFDFTPKDDVVQITYLVYLDDFSKVANGGGTNNGHTYFISHYCGEFQGDDKYQFSFEVSSEEAGLLSGIIGWLTNIFDSITSFFSNMIESISNLTDTIISWFEDLVNSIIELPSKLWQLISDGLKALFVPSEEYIIGFKEDINELLAEKLGAVYQVIDITFESWDEITASDKANSINIPLVSIDLPNNAVFSFGGYKVQIVPNGFDFLVNAIKSIVGILCTILFINGLRKRYDEVMGVEI